MDEKLQALPYDEAMAALTAIVTAYVSRTEVHPDLLPPLIARIKRVLVAEREECSPAYNSPSSGSDKSHWSLEGTIQADYIICLEDGRRFKSLKRHLKSKYNMDPDEYRRKWNLPVDYPMVAPGYAQTRARIAREVGLGVTISKRNRKL